MKVVVYHSVYGCDTGCCGHIVELDPDEEHGPSKTKFEFIHPYMETPEDVKEWVRELVTGS
jgi:hypothetical protein